MRRQFKDSQQQIDTAERTLVETQQNLSIMSTRVEEQQQAIDDANMKNQELEQMIQGKQEKEQAIEDAGIKKRELEQAIQE